MEQEINKYFIDSGINEIEHSPSFQIFHHPELIKHTVV
jgi:hypothetical protein